MTGVGEGTDLTRIAELSHMFPLAEWGFLYSPVLQGRDERYPSTSFIQYAFESLPSHVRVALHICGAGVPDLLDSDDEVMTLARIIALRSGRIQLNFNYARSPIDMQKCIDFCKEHPSIDVITQHNHNNEQIWCMLAGIPNHAVLFDSSGGRGVACKHWPASLPDVACGYAGGLGPDNLLLELSHIQQAAGQYPFWIDMESNIRTNHELDLTRCESCLSIVNSVLAADYDQQ